MIRDKVIFSATEEIHPDLGSVVFLRYADSESGKNAEVGIAPQLGSNMFCLRADGHDLIYCDTAALARHEFTGNFVMFPFPNRVRDKKYRWEGQEYDLREVAVPSDDPHLIHGLVRDRAWDFSEPELLMGSAAAVQTWVEIRPDTPYFDAYPFPCMLTLTYILSKGKIRIEYGVENLGTQKMPFGFGLHPLFSTLSGPDATTLSVPAPYVMENGRDLLPTGRVRSVASAKYFDLAVPRPVRDIDLDDVFTGLYPQKPAVVDHAAQRRKISIFASDDFTHCTVYTMQKEKFICVEHQTCSTDAINLYEKGFRDEAHLMVLDPGRVHNGFIEYRIEDYR